MQAKRVYAGIMGLLLIIWWSSANVCAGEKLTENQFKSLLGVLVRDQTPRYIGQGSGKILIVPVKPEYHRAFVAASLPALLVAVGSLYREKLADIDSMETSGDLWHVGDADTGSPGPIEMAVYGISLQKSWVEILSGQNKGRTGWMLNTFLDMDRRQFRPIKDLQLKGLAQFEPQDDYQRAEELRKEIEQHRLK